MASTQRWTKGADRKANRRMMDHDGTLEYCPNAAPPGLLRRRLSSAHRSFLDELSKQAAIDFINDDVDVTIDAPIARLLIREEARGDATCDGVLITLGSTDVNVIANVRQQYQIVCRIDLKRHNLPVVVRSGFAFRAGLVVHAVIHLKVLVARVGFECIRASALSRDHRAHGLGTCVDP